MRDLGELGVPADTFLASVREKLGRDPGAPPEPYEPLLEDLASLERRARETQERLHERRDHVIAELARVSALRGWNVFTAANAEEAVDYLLRLSESLNVRRVVRSDEPVFDQVTVDGGLEGMGAAVQVMARGHQRSGGFDPASADLGVTGVDYAIAETGTAVILPRRGVSRLTSLLPPVHVAIARRSEVLETLDDLYLFRRLEYHRNGGDMGSYMNFITGPSRTADIEQTLVIGAHGPRETHLIILNEA